MNCHWENIDTFRSLNEFESFVAWMENQMETGRAIEVSVEKKSAGKMISERWFSCTNCQSKWRLVYPDPGYFSGSFLFIE